MAVTKMIPGTLVSPMTSSTPWLRWLARLGTFGVFGVTDCRLLESSRPTVSQFRPGRKWKNEEIATRSFSSLPPFLLSSLPHFLLIRILKLFLHSARDGGDRSDGGDGVTSHVSKSFSTAHSVGETTNQIQGLRWPTANDTENGRSLKHSRAVSRSSEWTAKIQFYDYYNCFFFIRSNPRSRV